MDEPDVWLSAGVTQSWRAIHGHAHMRGFATVLSQQDFTKWIDDKIKEQADQGVFQ